MTTYTEATTALDAATIRDANLALAASLGANVSGWDAKAPQRAMFEIEGQALEREQRIRVKLAQSGFITRAAEAGEDYFDEALTWFDLDNGFGGKGRIPAVATVWDLVVSCVAAAGPYTISMARGELVAQANDGTLFESIAQAPTTIEAGNSATIRFVAASAGTSGNQDLGAIAHLVIGRAGMSVTNPDPQVTHGRDKETAAQATARALGKWATIGAGWTRSSFDYLVPTIQPSITKWVVRDDNPYGTGSIGVVLATADGPSSPTENAAVLAGLTSDANKTLGTGEIRVVSASTLTVTVAGTLYGIGSNPTLLADAKAALRTLRAAYPIGGDEDGYLRREVIQAVLMGGAWPATAPLAVIDRNGDPANIVFPGFSGAKNLALSSPLADVLFGQFDDLDFDDSGLVLG